MAAPCLTLFGLLPPPHLSEYICIAMEYASGGSLFQYVQNRAQLKEGVARWFFQQLIIGVDYIHRRGVASRDIKLENTLLQNADGLPLPLVKICGALCWHIS